MGGLSDGRSPSDAYKQQKGGLAERRFAGHWKRGNVTYGNGFCAKCRSRLNNQMQIEIEQPELLQKLCDYLSRHGFIAVAASRKRAQVLIPGAGSRRAEHLLLEARLRAWSQIHPGAGVRIEP